MCLIFWLFVGQGGFMTRLQSISSRQFTDSYHETKNTAQIRLLSTFAAFSLTVPAPYTTNRADNTLPPFQQRAIHADKAASQRAHWSKSMFDICMVSAKATTMLLKKSKSMMHFDPKIYAREGSVDRSGCNIQLFLAHSISMSDIHCPTTNFLAWQFFFCD